MVDSHIRQFHERIIRYIRQYQMLVPGDRVLVAVSGGIDSVTLLSVLSQLQHRLEIQLHTAHLNHQFRGQEAERDADFVRRVSQQLGIPCSIETRNVPELIKQHKLSPQDAARQARYDCLKTLARQVDASKIATAHTADDQAETVLLGLIRGVGLRGLGGIQPILNGKIIRPFLETTRAQIEAFAQHEHIEFVEDSSNASRKYTRNAVRLDLIPLLQQQFNPSIVKRLSEYARRFREDAECIERIARKRYARICKNVPHTIKINLDLFAKECITIQRALIYKSFEELTGTRHLLESQHARAVIDVFTANSSGKRISLPRHIRAYREAEWGYLTSEQERICRSEKPETRLLVPGTGHIGALRIETEVIETRDVDGPLCTVVPNTQWVQYVDADQVVFPIVVRYRRPGDAFQPLGMQGKKRVKKFFIDRKIPQNKRESIPIFEDLNGIFWIVGYSIDERVKITQHTTRVLRCCVYHTERDINQRKKGNGWRIRHLDNAFSREEQF
jgi:tRNA(Ile)-lysidine synthase